MELLNKLIQFVSYIVAHYADIMAALSVVMAAISGLCTALIAFFTFFIKGPHPEKELRAIVEFIARRSKK